MAMGRRFSIVVLVLGLNCLLAGAAYAGFFGFGSDDKGTSGLDFSRGYDVNTVATVSGKVSTLPHQGDRGQLFLEVTSGSGRVEVNLGPGSFWERKGLDVHLNDELSVKGSSAQGQDGRTYLLTQKLTNKTTGREVELRSEKGEPAWSRRLGGMEPMRSPMQNMMRGEGLMRGGGGMMRH